MFKKLSLLSVLSTLFVLLFSTFSVSAETLPDSARSLPSSGEFTPGTSSEGEIRATSSCTPTYRFTVDMNRPLFGTDNALATSTAYETCNGSMERNNIDLVYANAKLYQNGGLQGSNSDTTRHGSYAGARVNNQSSSTSGLEAYGEHRFKEAGYMEHNFNTYDN